MRDDKGWVLLLAKFSAIGIKDCNEVEYSAIVFALELLLDKDWLKMGSLVVESDSKNAIAWIKSSCPWHLCFLANKLRNILGIVRNVTLIHKIRESNHIANSLAKESVSLEGS